MSFLLLLVFSSTKLEKRKNSLCLEERRWGRGKGRGQHGE
jgi:hypothetical protein